VSKKNSSNKSNNKKSDDKEKKKSKVKKKEKSKKQLKEEKDSEENKVIKEIVTEEIEPNEAKEIKFINKIELTGDPEGEHLVLNLYQTHPINTDEVEEEIKIKKEKRLINRVAITAPHALRTAEKIESKLRGPSAKILEGLEEIKLEIESEINKKITRVNKWQIGILIGILVILIFILVGNFTNLEELITILS